MLYLLHRGVPVIVGPQLALGILGICLNSLAWSRLPSQNAVPLQCWKVLGLKEEPTWKLQISGQDKGDVGVGGEELNGD